MSMSNLRRAVIVLAALFSGAAFAQNPMDYVGQQHNEYLGCLERVNPDASRNPLEVLVTDCGFQPEQPADEFIQEYTALMPEDQLAPLSVKLEPYRAEFNDQQYGFALEIENILSTQTPDEADKALEALEANAVESLGREKADLAVLSGLSTARYSLRFWQANPPAQAKKAKWWQVVLGDVAGGIVGGVFGGGVGAVGLGAACSNAVATL
ncbi:MAG: hypothetical protein ACXU86_09970 [Archangium sp.]